MVIDNDDAVHRCDGSAIVGLTHSKWVEIKKMYPLLSPDELDYYRDLKTTPTFDTTRFEALAGHLNRQREIEVTYGRHASHATSFFMLLSVHVRPRKKKSLSLYGEITPAPAPAPNSGSYIYRRESNDVQHFESSDGGYLTLNGPPKYCDGDKVCSLFQTRKLSIRLCDQQRQRLYPLVEDKDPIILDLDYSPDDFEHVTVKEFINTKIVLTLKYVSIPMAVYGYLEFRIFDRQSFGEYPNLSSFEDVHGKVVANYKSIFGDYSSQEFVLFDKNPILNQCQRISLGMGDNLLSSSRCWVVAPVFSLLRLRIDLFNSQKEPILIQDVELGTDNSYRSAKELGSGKYYISLSALWTSPVYLPSAEEDLPRISRCLIPPEQLGSAIEVFSILVCYEKDEPLQIHGHIRFTFDSEGSDIFKREEKEPFTLLGRCHTITEFEGSRLLSDFDDVTLKCDLDGNTGGWSIKGYAHLNMERYCGRQLCAIFRGDNGFAALHYAVFTSAAQANVKFYGGDVSGSICAQYTYFDYSSQYKRNCYRIVLFKSGEDSVKPDDDGLIPLSRSSFVVPSYSSAYFYFNLQIGIQKFCGRIEIRVGERVIKKIGEEFRKKNYMKSGKELGFGFELRWSEVK